VNGVHGKVRLDPQKFFARNSSSECLHLGVSNMVYASGQAVGAPLGGYLADTIGWRWSFLLQVPFALVAIASVSIALKLPERESDHFLTKLKRIDFTGAVVLVSGVFCLLLGLDRGGNVAWHDQVTIGCLTAFGVLSMLFVYVEARVAAEPFAPKAIVANPALVASYFANFFSAGTGLTLSFMITLYFQAVKARTAAEAGVVLLPAIVSAVAGSLIGGLIMQATGRYYWLTLGVFAMMVVGQVLVPGFSGVWMYSYAGIAVGESQIQNIVNVRQS
jgi:MFS family permease